MAEMTLRKFKESQRKREKMRKRGIFLRKIVGKVV